MQVVRNLILLGHEIHVVTAASEHIFTTEIQSPKLFIRKVNTLPSPIFLYVRLQYAWRYKSYGYSDALDRN